MPKRVLEVDYDALSEYLLNMNYSPEYYDDPNFLEFEGLRAHLCREVENMLAFSEDHPGLCEEPELIKILMADLGPDTVVNITVTKGVGIVTRCGDHLLKLPLILVDAEWRLECQL